MEEAGAIRPFANDTERQAYFQEALKLAKNEAESAPAEVANTQASGSWIANIPQGYSQSSPGQLVTWVLATLLAGAATLAAERTLGTLRRLGLLLSTLARTEQQAGRFGTLGTLRRISMIAVEALRSPVSGARRR